MKKAFLLAPIALVALLAVFLSQVMVSAQTPTPTPTPATLPAPPAFKTKLQFTGTVQEITPALWTISGLKVQVAPSTKIKGDPEVGDVVKVEGFLAEDGTIRAKEIKLKENVEFTGVVQVVSPALWTISGLNVQVSPSTKIKGDPEVGDVVKVEGSLAEDGTIRAKEIKLKENKGKAQEQGHLSKGQGQGHGKHDHEEVGHRHSDDDED